jgi:hypothetical protein
VHALVLPPLTEEPDEERIRISAHSQEMSHEPAQPASPQPHAYPVTTTHLPTHSETALYALHCMPSSHLPPPHTHNPPVPSTQHTSRQHPTAVR